MDWIMNIWLKPLNKGSDRLKELMNDIKSINSAIDDEKSKKIFMNRMMYSLSQDPFYIHNIINMLEEYQIVVKYMEMLKVLYGVDKVIIWGAGTWGKLIYGILNSSFSVIGFVDSDLSKKEFCNQKVYRPDEIGTWNDCAVFIASTLYYNEIEKRCVLAGISAERIINVGRIMRESLYRKQYFDSEIMKHIKEKKETFLDCGCFDGYTVDNFVHWCSGDYNRIISFEPDEKVYLKCIDNVEKKYKNAVVQNIAIGRKNEKLNFDNDLSSGGSRIDKNGKQIVQVMSIDEILEGTEATFIKMDIEGFELDALYGAKDTIIKYRPRLAICVYHKLSDIFENTKIYSFVT